MNQQEREVILEAIQIFKKNKFEFQKMWLNLATEEGIPLHEFMDFEAFIKSYFGCFSREAKILVQKIEGELKLVRENK